MASTLLLHNLWSEDALYTDVDVTSSSLTELLNECTHIRYTSACYFELSDMHPQVDVTSLKLMSTHIRMHSDKAAFTQMHKQRSLRAQAVVVFQELRHVCGQDSSAMVTWVSCLLPLLLLSLVPAGEGAACTLEAETSLDEDTLQSTVTIVNKGAKPVCVLKWETILDDDWWFGPFDFYENDEFTKPLQPVVPVRMMAPRVGDYVYLGTNVDNKQTQATRSLSEAFPFKHDPVYWLQLQTKPQDCFETTDLKKCELDDEK